jgi:hypothetical protein
MPAMRGRTTAPTNNNGSQLRWKMLQHQHGPCTNNKAGAPWWHAGIGKQLPQTMPLKAWLGILQQMGHFVKTKNNSYTGNKLPTATLPVVHTPAVRPF